MENISVNEDKIIAEIMKEHPDLYDQLDFNEFNVKERLEKNAYWYQHYRILYMKELHKLKNIEIARDKYIGDLYKELKNGDRKLTKTEIERYYLPSDKKAIQYMKLSMKYQIRCDVYQYICDAFKSAGYNMSTYVKNMMV